MNACVDETIYMFESMQHSLPSLYHTILHFFSVVPTTSSAGAGGAIYT